MSAATLSPADPFDAASMLPKLKSCSQLAKLVPNTRGKRTAAATIYRWMSCGRLRFVMVGDRRMALADWLLEMFEREAGASRARGGIEAAPRTRTREAGDRAAHDAAKRVGFAIQE